MTAIGTRRDLGITLSDFDFDDEPVTWTPITDPYHFTKDAVVRGVVVIRVHGCPSGCAVRGEYKGKIYQGGADEYGEADLLPLNG
jgi:hypothetical protein